MTINSPPSWGALFKTLAQGFGAGVGGPNQAPSLKRVEPTAEQKNRIAQTETVSAEAAYTVFLQGRTPRTEAASNTYTKFGRMNSDEQAAFVQEKLDIIAKGYALNEKLRNQKQ